MLVTSILDISSRADLYDWFKVNHDSATEFWIRVNRSSKPCPGVIDYADAVEVALCFGWIDSTLKKLDEGKPFQRFSPRRKGGNWCENNLARCKKLIASGEMTPHGLAAMPLIIREANQSEYLLLAESVLNAVGLNSFPSEEDRRLLDAISAECRRGDSLYSYKHALVAEKGGKFVGCVVSYPGDDYPAMRKGTWERVGLAMGDNSADSSDYETGPGEYYIDTLAVRPRGHDYGKLLLRHAIGRSQQAGYDHVTLIAEKDHPRLLAYYESVGFRKETELTFLDEQYYKMVYKPNRFRCR